MELTDTIPAVPAIAEIIFRCACQGHDCATPSLRVEVPTAMFAADARQFRSQQRMAILRAFASLFDDKLEEIRTALNDLDPATDRPPLERDVLLTVDAAMVPQIALAPEAEEEPGNDH